MPTQADAVLKSLRKMSCLVLMPANKRRDALCETLRHSVASVEPSWPGPESITPESGIIIAAVADLASDSVLYRLERKHHCLIGLVDEDDPTALKGIIDLGVHAIINRPTHPLSVVTALVLGLSISAYENRLCAKVGKLENNLRAAHTVERAARILARTLDIPEDQAYQHLRTKAMNRREPMHELAMQVIKAHAVLDDFTSRPAQEASTPASLRLVQLPGRAKGGRQSPEGSST
ncbi:MAG: ANTAR domain-containing response regulator [Parvibaculaceae bacterium]